MRLPLTRSTIGIAAAATASLFLLVFLFLSPLRPHTSGATSALRTLPPIASGPVRALHNPYTEWFLVWQNQIRSHTLVMAKTKSQDSSWVDEELADLPDLQRKIYVVDDPSAPLHTPGNKGNEAMAYLTYILDFYDDLPDVSTFIHNHAATWHNSDLLNRSTAETIRRLSLEKVVREGYVNLRCDLVPGCPVSAELNRISDGDTAARMNELVVTTMLQIFPEEKLPEILAQPCCAQFAVSRSVIQQHPKHFYETMRSWLLATDYPNQVSGRIFEYIWHYIFLSRAVFCPSEHLCYCDTFSICFETAEAWNQYTGIAKSIETFEDEARGLPPNQTDPRQVELRHLINSLRSEGESRKRQAFSLGGETFSRQKILYDAWEVLKMRGEL